MGTFLQRIAELRRMVGEGEKLVGTVEVSQIYAHYQLLGTNGRTYTTRVADLPSTLSAR